jgi:hypothetical protein
MLDTSILLALLSLGGACPQNKLVNNSHEYTKAATHIPRIIRIYVTCVWHTLRAPFGAKKNIVAVELKYWWIYERS